MLCKHCGEEIVTNHEGTYHVHTGSMKCSTFFVEGEHFAEVDTVRNARIASISLVKAEPYITGMIELDTKKEN